MKQKRRIVNLILFSIFVHLFIWFVSWSIGHGNKHSSFYPSKTIEEIVGDEGQSFHAASKYLQDLVLSPKVVFEGKEDEIGHTSTNSSTHSRNCWLGILIISKNRATNNNLIRTMGYLLSRLEDYRQFPICVALMNNERPSSFHKGLKIMEPLENTRYIEIVHGDKYAERLRKENVTLTYHGHSFPLSPHNDETNAGWHRNEIYDYALSLTFAQREFQVEYAMVIQDDAIVSKSFLADLLKAVSSLKNKPWYAIKLFYSDIFAGWGNDHILMMVLLCTCIALPITMITRWILHGGSAHSYFMLSQEVPKTTVFAFALVFLYYFGYTMILLEMISRQALFPPFHTKGLIPLSNKMAVLVGQVYPKRILPTLSSGLFYHISHEKGSATMTKQRVICDLIVDQVARENEWQQYLLVPNIVQHIGRQSSDFNRNQGDSILTWSASNSFPKEDEQF